MTADDRTLDRMRAPEVRRVTKADVRPLAAVLARAFHNDPVATYIFPDERKRPRGLERFFRLQLGGTFLRNGVAYTTTDLQGGAFWLPPASPRPGFRELLEQLPMVPLLGRQLMPTLRLIGVMQSHHPKTVAHYYLGTLGTDPPAQGHGVGSAMLAPVLTHCDKIGTPAYLESSNVDNVPFYRRHGFEVTKELQIPGGPMLWLMWRDPVPDRSPTRAWLGDERRRPVGDAGTGGGTPGSPSR